MAILLKTYLIQQLIGRKKKKNRINIGNRDIPHC